MQTAEGLKADTVWPMIVDTESGLRASAATAFYYSITDRTNLSPIRGTALNLL